MNNIYPKGSIITKVNDTNKYCIVSIQNDSYDCIIFPFGMTLENEKITIPFEKVDKIFHFGYKTEEYNKDINKKILSILLE